ncbi:MAG TPA: immunoglobulin domain-containing protein [Candidatus Paceibacterota bacterium]|nr:immunoglobulin domain-containing protein [Candidatus Paceibacterota bacterium]
MKKTALILMVFAALQALHLEAQTNLIYFDPFTASAGTPLNGTSPQDHGGTGVDFWIGPDTGMDLDGSVLTATEAPRNNYLPFSPLEGYKYRLSVDANPTHSGADWLAVGFSENTVPTAWFPDGNSSGWFLLRGENPGYPMHSFTGYSLDGGAALGWHSGTHNLAVVLDTTVPNWTFEFFVDGVSERGPVPFSASPDVNPIINYVGVGSYNTARGTFDNFKLETIYQATLTKPTLVEQPKNATVVLGGMARFSVTASGPKPISYQWYKNGTELLTDQIGSVLTLRNLTAADNGSRYSVRVSNDYGQVTSDNALLTVLNVAGPLVHKFSFADGTPNDSIGGVSGVLKGTASIEGGQLLLDGSDGCYVALGDYVVPPQGNATIVAWFNAASSLGTSTRIFDFGGGTLSYFYFTPREGTAGPAQLGLKTGSDAETVVAHSSGLNDDRNHVIAAVIDSTPADIGANGTMALYLDGELVGVSGLNGTIALTELESGPQNYLSKSQRIDIGGFFKGVIDEIRVYNTALSLAEISTLTPDENPATSPTILVQPQDTTAYLGGSATLSVSVLGSEPLFYQWQLNGVDVPGANTNPFQIDNVQMDDYGQYTVVITNRFGAVASAPAQLRQTRWSYAAWNDDASSGIDSQFVYTHAYNFGSSEAPEINGLTFTAIPSANPSVPGVFSVTGTGNVFNNDVNNLTGGSQVLGTDFIYGGAPGTLKLQGLNPGKEYLLTLYSVAFESPGARRIQFSAMDNQLLTVDQDTFDNDNGIRIHYQYTADASGSVVVTNTPLVAGATFHFYGFCNRLLQTIPANAPPEIITQPESKASALNSTASLGVAVVSATPLNYQWWFNGAPIPGATGTNYTLASVQNANFGDYSVVVQNTHGSVTSLVARLSLLRWSSSGWNDDASSGADTNYVYTHAYNFGRASATVINGLTFTGVAGANPSVSNRFSITGVGSVYNNDVNNLTGGSQAMAADFIYGGNPGTLTLQGLIPGKEYLLTLYSVGWESSGRTILFSAADHQEMIADQDAYDNDNGIRIQYQYAADASGTVSITTSQVGIGTFHMYGFSNRDWNLPEAVVSIARNNDGTVTLSWPASAVGYALRSTAALGANASWQTVPGEPVLSEGFYRQTIPAIETRYFRLQK